MTELGRELEEEVRTVAMIPDLVSKLFLFGVHGLKNGHSLLVVSLAKRFQLCVHVSVQCTQIFLQLGLRQSLQLHIGGHLVRYGTR